jgi:transient receptor potential cation channel subfamily A protein 1
MFQGKAGSKADMVQILLENGANVEQAESARHRAPLHLAIERGQADVVRVLLLHGARPGSRTSSSETALHCAVRGLREENLPSDEQAVVACLELLPLSDELLLNARDEIGSFTTVHLAAKWKQWRIVKLLLQHNAHVDVEINGVTARKIIADNASDIPTEMLQLLNNIPKREELPPDLASMLLHALRSKNESEFLSIIENNVEGFYDVKDISYGRRTLLQMASMDGYYLAAEKIINADADVNLTSREDLRTPCMLAAQNGHADVLKLLLKSRNVDLSGIDDDKTKMTALHLTVTSPTCKPECVKLLLETAKQARLDINAIDYREYTALHYAAKSNQSEIIALLLEHKANIFIQDYEKIPAFYYINDKYLKEFLDDQISTENSISSTEYTLVMNYDFMAPVQENVENQGVQNGAPRNNTVYIAVRSSSKDPVTDKPSFSNEPEMSPLMMLASSPDHRYLLNHPLIRGFLHLKWYRIFWIFYLNFIFYLLFTISISFHVYYLVTSDVINATEVEDNNLNISNIDNSVSKNTFSWEIAATIMLVLFIIRECFQMIVSFWSFIGDMENWLEMLLIALSAVLLMAPVTTYSLHSIAALVILLTYTEFVLLVGRHPSLATYITMFFRVSSSFVYFLLWYSLLIIGFGFAFYIVFQKCTTAEECEKNFFIDLGTSIFKTIIMLTGEFESGDLGFSSYSLISHLIFILFLFFIAIVLLNLLNGLAVSDTQAIRDEAEVVCCVAQVKLYAQLESLLLSEMKLPCCISPGRWVGRKLLILQRLWSENDNSYILRVKLNRSNQMVPDVRERWRQSCTDLLMGGGICCLQQRTCILKACRWCLTFNTIVGDARLVVAQRGHQSESQQIIERLHKLELAIEKITEFLSNTKL